MPTVRHVDYIGSCLEVLRDDNRAIVRAASATSKAVEYVLAFQDNRNASTAVVALEVKIIRSILSRLWNARGLNFEFEPGPDMPSKRKPTQQMQPDAVSSVLQTSTNRNSQSLCMPLGVAIYETANLKTSAAQCCDGLEGKNAVWASAISDYLLISREFDEAGF